MKPVANKRKVPLIFRLSWILGLLDLNRSGLVYKLYSGSLLILHIVAYILESFVFSYHVSEIEISSRLIVAKKVLGNILTISLMITIISLVFYEPTRFHNFMMIIGRFNQAFGSVPKKGYVLVLITMTECVFLSTFQSSVIEGTTEARINEYLFGQGLQRMTMGTAYYLRLFFTFEVANKFNILTNRLEKLSNYKNQVNNLKTGQTIISVLEFNCNYKPLSEMKMVLEEIKNISHFHNSICDASDILNKMFGLNMVSEVVFCIAFISQSTMNLIVHSEHLNHYFGFNKGTISCLIIIDICVSIQQKKIICSKYLL